MRSPALVLLVVMNLGTARAEEDLPGRRLVVEARPYFVRPHFAGVAITVEYQHQTRKGFLLGLGVDPLLLGYPAEANGAQTQVTLGYGGRELAIAALIGTGVPAYDDARLGIAVRVGAWDRVHLIARVKWALRSHYAAGAPVAAALSVFVPLRSGYGLLVDAACGSEDQWYYFCLSGHVMVGLGHTLARGGTLRAGIGAAFMGQAVPGPIASVGYERRF
jgi:hypothetical protein